MIGYSGGKDSTTALQLIWHAIASLPAGERQKPVHVLSSDTLVETPVIVDYIDTTLERINQVAERLGLPFRAQKVTPQVTDSFWVNLIGRGYPAPSKRFRWCTERLKIKPANRFILEQVSRYGEVILVLGVRKAESATRAQVMALHKRPGDRLARHTDLAGAWVYAPIADWTTDDVWNYLLNVPSPWGNQNRDLVTLYRNAQAGECPLVVDKTTPSCGNSRFGCWVCTVVQQDHSMESLIENGEEWMQPLLEIRDWLASTQDPAQKGKFRRLRRRDGTIKVGVGEGKKVGWGPYEMWVRKDILRRVLQAEKRIRQANPDGEMSPIFPEELHEIRRIWRTEEGDWEDSLPGIYREVFGQDLDWVDDDVGGSTKLDAEVLRRVCGRNDLPSDLLRELVDVVRQHHGMSRRSGIYNRIEAVLRKDWRDRDEVLASLPGAPGEGSKERPLAD